MSEKYIIIKKGNIQINLYVDIDLDDIIINKQELFEVFKKAGFEIEEGQDAPPYESYITMTEKTCITNGDCESCNLLYGDCNCRK